MDNNFNDQNNNGYGYQQTPAQPDNTYQQYPPQTEQTTVLNGTMNGGVFTTTPVSALPLEETPENVLAGAVGALLFSLAGGIVWFLLYQVGFIAAISGLIGVVCAIKGYEIFAKKLSVKGVVISVIMAVIVIAAAWYLCLAKDVFDAYKEWYAAGDVDFTVTFGEAVRGAYVFLEDGEIASAYIKDLLFGLLFCALGAISPIRNAVAKAKQHG